MKRISETGRARLSLRLLLATAAAVTFAVIVLGAYVRLADAGLGCPDWPGCYGQIVGVPAADDAGQAIDSRRAWIEVSHRYLAALLGVLIVAAAAVAFVRPASRAERMLAAALVGMVCGQGLLGALTVTERLMPAVVAAHLIGGMLILALLCAYCARVFGTPAAPALPGRLRLRLILTAAGLVLLLQLFLGVWVSANYAGLSCGFEWPTCNGALSIERPSLDAFALDRELGLDRAGAPIAAAALTTVNWLHRLGALAAAAVIGMAAWLLFAAGSRRLAVALAAAVSIQFALGVTAVVSALALPAALAHNAGAAALVAALAAAAAQVFAPAGRAGPMNGSGELALAGAAGWRDYLRLTKPRVVALIVFTAVVGMAAALPGAAAPVDPLVLIAAVIGIGAAAAGAAAANCMIEHAIDAKMLRTRQRPTATGRISPAAAGAFALSLAGAGLVLLALAVNLLTAALTLATFFGYALVYTVWLKPATPQNIVIGGAAGAMPPVLGWSAATGSVTHEPLLLFLIIFVWTPPHFWALALYRRDDYRNACIPMLPVTHGADFTRLQILLYSLILFAASMLPFAAGMAGWIYLAVAAAAGAVFVWLAARIWIARTDDAARRLFAYSGIYLLLLFASVLADALALRLP